MEKKRQVNRKSRWKIWLAILSGVIGQLSAAGEEAVRFYMQIDTTPHGIHREQEFEVRYICTTDFDSISLPDFEPSQEVVSGPIPHRSGHAVENGVLTDIYEQGFGYGIRFKKEGKNDLPPASVKIDGKTYETPPLSVWVHPAVALDDSVQCRLRLSETYRGNQLVRVALVCNRRPDSRRPRLLVDGRAVEATGHSSSLSNTKEEYEFYYSFPCEGKSDFIFTCENLSFGGKPYPMKEQVLKVGNSGPAQKKSTRKGGEGPVLAVILAYLLAVWWATGRCFRKEGREDLASFVLKNKYLNLSTDWALTHYGLSLILLGIPVFFLGLNAYSYYSQGKADFYIPLFWCGLLPAVLAFVVYRRQRAKLYFEPVKTSLSLPDLQVVLAATAEKHRWTIDHLGNDCMAAHTNPSIWSFTWGEQVFVVFDEGQVWINSVNDLNKRSAIVSFGHTKRNIRVLKEAIAGKATEESSQADGRQPQEGE